MANVFRDKVVKVIFLRYLDVFVILRRAHTVTLSATPFFFFCMVVAGQTKVA
jgi:hypothetical protein